MSTITVLHLFLWTLAGSGAGQGSISAVAASDFTSELNCLVSLKSVAHGHIAAHSSIVIPATRGGRQGFYIYSKKGSSFHGFPETRPARESRKKYYFSGPFGKNGQKRYFSYFHDSNDLQDDEVLSESVLPESGKSARYVPLGLSDHTDHASKKAFEDYVARSIDRLASLISFERAYNDEDEPQSQTTRWMKSERSRRISILTEVFGSCGRLKNKTVAASLQQLRDSTATFRRTGHAIEPSEVKTSSANSAS